MRTCARQVGSARIRPPFDRGTVEFPRLREHEGLIGIRDGDDGIEAMRKGRPVRRPYESRARVDSCGAEVTIGKSKSTGDRAHRDGKGHISQNELREIVVGDCDGDAPVRKTKLSSIEAPRPQGHVSQNEPPLVRGPVAPKSHFANGLDVSTGRAVAAMHHFATRGQGHRGARSCRTRCRAPQAYAPASSAW